jgi:hypothetical protein
VFKFLKQLVSRKNSGPRLKTPKERQRDINRRAKATLKRLAKKR